MVCPTSLFPAAPAGIVDNAHFGRAIVLNTTTPGRVGMSTTVTWTATSSGNWSDEANWSDDAVPNSNDNVLISTSSVQTITYDTGNTTINELTVGNDHFVMANGSLEILTNATFNDGYVQTGGTLESGTVKILKSGTLTGGSATGSTVLNIAGGIALANYTLAGSAELNNNNAVISQTGQITVGDNTGVDATIDNMSGGTYQIAGDYGITGGAASAVLDNAGVLEKSAGSGTSNIGIDVVSTGTISVASGGTLAFSGPTNVIGGALTGAGTVEFANAGNSTLTVASITTGAVEIESATVTLGTSTTLSGSLDETAGGVLSIGANTLTVNGAASSIGLNGNALVTGTGTLDNAGTLTLMALQVGGEATLENTGSVNQVYNVTVGDSSGEVAHVINAAGASWTMASGYQLEAGSSTAQTFTNDGSFSLNGTSGSSSVEVLFTSAAGASIGASTGTTLAFDSITTNAGHDHRRRDDPVCQLGSRHVPGRHGAWLRRARHNRQRLAHTCNVAFLCGRLHRKRQFRQYHPQCRNVEIHPVRRRQFDQRF